MALNENSAEGAYKIPSCQILTSVDVERQTNLDQLFVKSPYLANFCTFLCQLPEATGIIPVASVRVVGVLLF